MIGEAPVFSMDLVFPQLLGWGASLPCLFTRDYAAVLAAAVEKRFWGAISPNLTFIYNVITAKGIRISLKFRGLFLKFS
jgi:hypothetical protein